MTRGPEPPKPSLFDGQDNDETSKQAQEVLETCPICEGKGMVDDAECIDCEGTGKVLTNDVSEETEPKDERKS